MDRDCADRVELALKRSPWEKVQSKQFSKRSILTAYDQSDEFVSPICNKTKEAIEQGIKPNDSILFMNFRADRAREISRSLTDETFAHFVRKITTKCLRRPP